jgi:hypothetical protein
MHLRDIQAAIIDYAETHGQKPVHGYIHKEDMDLLQLGGLPLITEVDVEIPTFALGMINGVLFLDAPGDRLKRNQFALGHTTLTGENYEERNYQIYPKDAD